MTSLRERVEAEFENIERVLAEFPEDRSYAELSMLELAGVAALLHNFYNGIENILKYVVHNLSINLPEGDSWHRDLVNLATSEKLIRESTATDLRPYLAFRHFFVHAYAFDLQPERLEPLSNKARETFSSFRKDIDISTAISGDSPPTPR